MASAITLRPALALAPSLLVMPATARVNPEGRCPRFQRPLLEPFAPRLLDARAARGKEDPARVDERMGFTRVERPEGDLVWLHGVSVGETLSLLPVVERLRRRRPDLSVLVTSGTLTSAQLLAKRLPTGVIHQFAPVDTPGAVAAFLDHWRPAAAVFVESELWPNLILEARRRGVKLVLASARITEKTVDGWRRFPGAAREILSAFDRILPQDETSAARLHSLGARIDGHVNLKLSGDAPPHDAAAFTRLSAAIAWMLCWPLVQASLQLWPHIGYAVGLSGLLHAGVAVMAMHMVLGSLRNQLTYPDSQEDVSDRDLLRLLERVNLGDVASRFGGLDTELDWAKVLSPGEQQRIAFARVLLTRLAPAHTAHRWVLAATAWTLAFALYLWVFTPWLLSTRLDGKDG